ncbi:unnamed protein product [Vicia faba]|uniref:Uncharacterized protein n=1 Tax=Vicia faba TaxID=3906 RepID=A0AAV0Z638_VICFA|nr:unnamed protein product [Vicia faba]
MRTTLDKLYVEALNYNEIVELSNDVKLLKTMLNVGACYPMLVKELVVKNDGIVLGLLDFSSKLFARKDVLDISLHNVSVIDESGLQSEVTCCYITGFLYHVGTHAV